MPDLCRIHPGSIPDPSRIYAGSIPDPDPSRIFFAVERMGMPRHHLSMHAFCFAGTYMNSRFMLVGTPSGITLAPEGGAHQSIGTPLIGASVPNLLTYEPAYADEVKAIMRSGFEYMQAADGGSVYLRLSTRGIDQVWNYRAPRTHASSPIFTELALMVNPPILSGTSGVHCRGVRCREDQRHSLLPPPPFAA